MNIYIYIYTHTYIHTYISRARRICSSSSAPYSLAGPALSEAFVYPFWA